VISLGGDWFLTVALLDLVLEMTGSGLLAALVTVAQMLPAFVLAPYAGTIVDRVDRRRLMIAVNLVAMVAALLPLFARSTATLPLAFVGIIGISCSAAFFGPAAQAALPNIVRGRDLAPANVLMGSTWGTMLAVGAALGGVVTTVLGREVAIMIDSVSFLVAALLLWSIRSAFQETRSREHIALLPAVREAATYARRDRRVLALLACKGGYGIAAGVIVLLGVFSTEIFDTGAAGIGLLYGARGAGALLGPFLIRRFSTGDSQMFQRLGACIVLYGIGYACFAVSPFFALAALAVFVAHLGGGAQWTVVNYGLQSLVPDALRGRIFAADFGFATLTMSLSSLAAGLLSDAVGPVQTALLLSAVALLWGMLWTVWTRPLWQEEPARALSGAPP
jgi:MFS family permease